MDSGTPWDRNMPITPMALLVTPKVTRGLSLRPARDMVSAMAGPAPQPAITRTMPSRVRLSTRRVARLASRMIRTPEAIPRLTFSRGA
jgi:hypothetical protein